MPTDPSTGDIIPSFLSLSETPDFDDGNALSNFPLRFGEVIRKILPDDKESFTKTFVEYDVFVPQRENGVLVNKVYKNCILSNFLGSKADKTRFTLRIDKGTPLDKKNGFGKGSRVLLLCINGETANAVIIGGLRYPEENDKDLLEEEHIHEWEFNGLSSLINDDGAFRLTFKGPTTIDGTLDEDKVKEESTGTSFQIDKDGNLKLLTRDEEQYFELNHKDGKINLQFKNKFTINDGSEAFVNGTTYRREEKQLNDKLSNNLTTLQTLLTTAATNFTTAVPLLAVPVVGGSLASPSLTQVALSLTSMISVVAQMLAAYKAFEGNSKNYLSDNNKFGD